MKKHFLCLAVALLLGSTTCMAQDQRREHPNKGQRSEQKIKELGLNDQQTKLFKEAMEEMKPSKEKGQRPTREEMETKRKKLDEKIKGILTEEQYNKYLQMRQHRNQRPMHQSGQKKLSKRNSITLMG